MASNAFEWVARVVMLVLAGLVTLSILGSIAAMSNDGGPGSYVATGDRPLVEAAPPTNAQAPAEPSPQIQPEEAREPADGPPGSAGVVATAATPEKEEERWLEAIAYALLALAGLGAIGLVLLWGVLRELRRICDGLVSRPPRP